MRTTDNNSSVAVTMSLVVDIANKVVSRYVFRSVIPEREREDVVMAIVEKFLNQKDKIEKAFEGKSKLTTYFVAILNRMCCEVIRKESRHWYSIVEGEPLVNEASKRTLEFEAEKSFAIVNEVKRLNNTMLLFNGERAKISLFLKYYFDLPIDYADISDYAGSRVEEVKELLQNATQISKGDTFDNLSQVVNIVEEKSVKGDAVRMWMNKQIEIILSRLNKNGMANHDKDSLAVLLEIQQTQN